MRIFPINFSNFAESPFFKAWQFLTRRDKQTIVFFTFLQVFLGILDLVGVVLLGALGAISVSGFISQSPGTRVGSLLQFLGLQNLSLQTQVALIGISAAVVLLLRTATSVLITSRTLHFLAKKSSQISTNLCGALFKKDLSAITATGQQELVYSLTSGVNTLTVGIIGSALTIVSDLSVLLILTVGIFLIDPLSSVLVFFSFLSIGVALFYLLHTRALAFGRLDSKMSIKQDSLILDLIRMYREITVRNLRTRYIEDIRKVQTEHSRILAKMAFLPTIGKYVIEGAVIVFALLLSSVQFLRADAVHAVATLSIFLAAGSRMAPAVLRIQQSAIKIRESEGSSLPTLKLIESLSPIPEQRWTPSHLHLQKSNFQAKILIKSVEFKYSDSSNFGITDLNLALHPGQKLALVGPSGSGKSTIVDLMLGLLTPTSGIIEISNMNPLDAFATWPGLVAYVPQNIRIKNDSIRNNILLGSEFQEVPDEKILETLRIVQLDSLIENFPMGLDENVGDDGSKLSGGQRQRLGIARALITDPEVLILDEATSALDGQVEKDVTSRILQMNTKMSIVIIAHRLSTVVAAEKVMYISNGKVKATGTFDEVRKAIPDFDTQASLMGL